ncbi:galactosylgalactosylxylosylprotein 3-beta-glucuronosyltransferase 1 isoform X2 [Rhinatrema bivittatum]|uniref:galactosylgalactosylxylosylprotein 3-beta-glucuronosyltransferase 1 isoform X2 n=1 Tax=Rhinatrema bivittatum TaxID=194408 RepID=UPI001126C5BB|nr:galactosylgalactosylxylosylprotein 3-beta-glucuronosyltransferase 1 isoform X2 [Rhinatrema bivittatum]
MLNWNHKKFVFFQERVQGTLQKAEVTSTILDNNFYFKAACETTIFNITRGLHLTLCSSPLVSFVQLGPTCLFPQMRCKDRESLKPRSSLLDVWHTEFEKSINIERGSFPKWCLDAPPQLPAPPLALVNFSSILCSSCTTKPASAMGNEERWVQSALEMPKRRDILAIVLIILPWTLLITVWHQSTIAPLLAVHKDDGSDGRRDLGQGSDFKEYCSSDRDIVEVVRTEYVYTRPPPWSDNLPTIHVITPTYSRPVQKAELTRLANTLLHVPNLHWILVEDSQRRTPLVTRMLRETGLNYTHLNVETPRNYKLRGDMRDPRIPRGTMQRNLALRWLRDTFNKNNSEPGIVYFADDDNTYSLELFEEMRSTRKVSVWPVAFVGGLRYESPKVNAAGKVYGWKTVFDPHRPFAIDMAGFAVNLRLILQRSQAYFKLRGVKGGYQESSLLRELVTLNDLEPKAANCTKILVWHTRTEKPVLVNEGKKGFTDPNVEI